MDEVLKYIFEYLVMGQLKFGMENRFIILLKYNQNCPQQLAKTQSKIIEFSVKKIIHVNVFTNRETLLFSPPILIHEILLALIQ